MGAVRLFYSNKLDLESYRRGTTRQRGEKRRKGKESARISHFPKVGTAFSFTERARERERLLSQVCEPLTNLLFLVDRPNITEHRFSI